MLLRMKKIPLKYWKIGHSLNLIKIGRGAPKNTSTARHFSLHHNDSALSRLAIPTPRVDTLILKSDPPTVRHFDRKPENQLSRCLAGSSPVITSLEVGLVANLHQIRSIGWIFPAEGDNNNGYTTYGVLYS